jgi:DNA-binding winged helix-turn-helix (wHTH) protein/pimeloyl-ACP methyl ester carboxylesterase
MYAFEDCELDPRRLILRRSGQVVHVEPQVFDVLRHLIDNRDRVVPKHELLDAVWGNRFVSESALTSRLKAARRAIGDDGHQQRVIHTVHGVGYRFVASVRELAASRPEPRARALQDIRFCRAADGSRIAYASSGTGEPMVKAANWLTHLDLEWDSPIWAHWIDGLSASHRLVRYDERGCGLSDWTVSEFGFDTWVEDLELVVDSAGLDAFTLLGVSQGGAVAIAYAVRHPERVLRLVLVGAYSRGRLARAVTQDQRETAELDLAVGREAWRRDDPSYRQVFAAQFLPDGDRSLWDAFNDLQRATTSTENVVRFLDTFARIDVSDQAPRVRSPTLILHSRGDLRVPESQARELACLIPDSRIRFLDSRNHILTASEPSWPTLLREIDQFTTATP